MNRNNMAGFIAALSFAIAPLGSFGENAAEFSFGGFEAQVESYLERYHDPAFAYHGNGIDGRFSYQPGKAFDLYGSADMVYLLYTLGELEQRTTPEGRKEWAKLIQSFQDPETGWFTLGNETAHFKEHATAYAAGALILLGEKPAYPFKWAEEITQSEKATDKWLSGIWWDVVWVGSHQGGGVAASLAMTNQAPDQWFDWYFAWLDREVNPKTGLWQRGTLNLVYKRPMKNDLGGAAHFWWVYQYKGRDIPYPEQVIDSVLGLQQQNDLWEVNQTKPDIVTCINCDAVNGINAAYAQLLRGGRDYRRADIEDSYRRFLHASARILNTPDCLEKRYVNSHDLPGGIIAVVEADRFFRAHLGKSLLKTKKAWRSVFEAICWI